MSLQYKLATTLSAEKNYSAKESWRLFGIMAEFVEGTERLDAIRPAVSIFGSARTHPDHPQYQLAEQIARQLSDAGFSVISGGGAKGAPKGTGLLGSGSAFKLKV